MSTNPPSQRNPGSIEDIPEAIRNIPPSPKVKSSQAVVYQSGNSGQRPLGYLLAIAGAGVALLALLSGLFYWQQTQSNGATTSTSTQSGHVPSSSPSRAADQVLGHFAYAAAPESALEIALPGDSILLRKPAAAAFQDMLAAAQSEGVSIVLISGFRSLADQNHLFFDVKRDRAQTAKERAEVSAPPGYSEHHTGYAMDIGDAQAPSANLNQFFEDTAVFRWMQANAARFSFELSFPKNNPQGVSYEPWHWRFVGDRDSLETFYKARTAKIAVQ